MCERNHLSTPWSAPQTNRAQLLERADSPFVRPLIENCNPEVERRRRWDRENATSIDTAAGRGTEQRGCRECGRWVRNGYQGRITPQVRRRPCWRTQSPTLSPDISVGRSSPVCGGRGRRFGCLDATVSGGWACLGRAVGCRFTCSNASEPASSFSRRRVVGQFRSASVWARVNALTSWSVQGQLAAMRSRVRRPLVTMMPAAWRSV